MAKRVLMATMFLGLLSCASGAAQTLINECPYSKNHWNDLACLIPTVTKTGVSNNLSGFNTTLSEIISELPLAAPVSGFTLGLDRNLGVYVATNENLGSILTERGDTIGKHKFFVGFTFQRFVFQSIDGRSLGELPVVYKILQSGSTIYGGATASLGANINQYTAVAAFGLTDRIDVSLTLPFERVSLSSGLGPGLQAVACPGCSGTSTAPQSAGGSASGPGDLILNAKATVVKKERFRLAAGTEIRFATGDEYNLLGSGAWGIKPYVVLSRRGRFQPHVNLGYQWNSFSVLFLNGGVSQRLPDSLDYSGGADIGVNKRLTFVADLVGQHFFDAPRVTAPELGSQFFNDPNYPTVLSGYSTVAVQKSSFDVDNLGVGFKLNPFGRILVSANVMIKLNDAGLRANYVPLVGVSYRF